VKRTSGTEAVRRSPFAGTGAVTASEFADALSAHQRALAVRRRRFERALDLAWRYTELRTIISQLRAITTEVRPGSAALMVLRIGTSRP